MRGAGILGLAGAAIAAPAVPQPAEPHKHEREIARRKRQAERVRENRIARAEQEATRNGFGRSRRGSLVDIGAPA